jgi:HAD superfamily hydrolase (TIGR01549 family)
VGGRAAEDGLNSLMPRAVLFDLDDTLFDHRRSAGAALANVHQIFAPSVAFDAFERHHTRYLEEMHIEVLAGRIALDEARRERFRRVFGALGLSIEEDQTDAVATAYRAGYLIARRATEGAAELLAAVHPRARIAIVSNNLLDEQREKLQFCGLDRFVDALIVSEEAGIAKPDPGIFQLALDRVGASATDAVMVGDSWAADIVGATRAGVHAVWFNPARAARPTGDRDIAGIEEIVSLTPVEPLLPLLLGTSRLADRRPRPPGNRARR